MDRILMVIIRIMIWLARYAKPLSGLGIGTFDAWRPGEKLKLLIVGYNGARNTGADARTVAAVKQIRDLFGPDKVRITVLTLNKENLQGYFDEDVELLEFSSVFPFDLYRACCAHHAAVLCEGSTLKSTFANALSLFFCEASGVMARQGKPCIAFGSEVGYMEPALERFAAKTCRETYFICRTKESLDALRKIGLKGHLGTDTAWLYEGAMESAKIKEMLTRQGWDGKAKLLGVAVIDPFCWPVRASLAKWIRGVVTGDQSGRYDKWYYYSDSEERRAAYQIYIEEIGKAVNRLCCEEGFFPVLLGMEKMDAGPCGRLQQKLETPCAVFLSGECSADIMTGVLRQLSALITSRYHAAVLSMDGGCPIAAVSMDERLDSLMRENALEENYLFSVSEADLGNRVAAAVTEGMEHRDEIRGYLKERVAKYQEMQREMGAFLKNYLLNGPGHGSEK